jgi:small subunit ribosomal protein S6
MLYEITYILKPELTLDEQSELNSKVAEIIASLEGKATPAERTFSVERGGTDENHLRKFAYPIKHYRQGYYYTTTFELAPTRLKELDSTLQREANILRFLIVKDFINLSEIPVEEKVKDSKEEDNSKSETKVKKSKVTTEGKED